MFNEPQDDIGCQQRLEDRPILQYRDVFVLPQLSFIAAAAARLVPNARMQLRGQLSTTPTAFNEKPANPPAAPVDDAHAHVSYTNPCRSLSLQSCRV